MKPITDHDRFVHRRLRKAFHHTMLSVLKRSGDPQELRDALKRVTAHAFKIGWLQATKEPSKGPSRLGPISGL